MFKKYLAVIIAALFLMGCAGVGVTVDGAKDPANPGAEIANIGLELLAFNGGYLLADKYPAKYGEVMQEIKLLEGVLAGNNVDAANAAFQLGVQKLLTLTNNDPLVRANVSFIAKKIKFVQKEGEAKPVIDIPQMKAIIENFKAGAESRMIFGY